MEDAELLDRIRGGDRDAWRDLLDAYGRLVYAIPRKLGLSQADVEEVFQNTWLLVHEHVGQVRDADRLRAWISTTATRESWRLRRRERPEAGLDDSCVPDRHAEPAREIELLELRSEVRRGIEALRQPCTRLLRALFFGRPGRSYAEVAEELGMPIGSLGPTRARCLADLAQYLEQRGVSGLPNPDSIT